MAETVPGGAYLAPDGKTYHDANGQPVDASAVRALQQQQREREAQIAEAERERQLRSPDALTVMAALMQQQGQQAPPAPVEPPKPDKDAK